MDKTDQIRLQHMLDAAHEARQFVVGIDRSVLDTNRILLLALVRELEVIGEAASRVSEACRQQYPQIVWRDIIDMRNYLIHGYFKVDADLVWSTIQDDLPPLITELETILASVPPSTS